MLGALLGLLTILLHRGEGWAREGEGGSRRGAILGELLWGPCNNNNSGNILIIVKRVITVFSRFINLGKSDLLTLPAY